jgi:hypothetical protein
LLSVLLFNWVGYRLFTAWCEDRAATRTEANLDNDRYDSSQLILLRVPTNALPYSNASPQFQKTTGTIEIGSARYRKVSKRLYNDSIEILCIPDGDANRLQSAGNDFFKLVNDLQKTKAPGTHGKTAGNKIVWYGSHHFPSLHYLAAHPVVNPPFRQTRLSTGYPRIGLRPPRPAGTLS